MKIQLVPQLQPDPDKNAIYLFLEEKALNDYTFSKTELEFIKNQLKDKKETIHINSYVKWSYLQKITEKNKESSNLEKSRLAGAQLLKVLNDNNHQEIAVIDLIGIKEIVLGFIQGMFLANYQFLKYKNQAKEEKNALEKLTVFSQSISEEELHSLIAETEAVYKARDLVNEPVSYLNATQLARDIQQLSKESGFLTEVFTKKKIETLKMGGLLAVNKGSIDPPTFSVLEWKPQHAKNTKPVILVGKGIVYDSGGLSLKPTLNSMDEMKSDMAGAAAVAGTLYAIAKMQLPLYVIGLIPATDNRPGENAFAPGDIIKMYNGSTVEVLNSDAEGRMILADALSYAAQYDPMLVIDVATLTGSAAVAIGKYAAVVMGSADKSMFNKLETAGQKSYERVVRFPLWDEYGDLIKSDIADLKNIGGREAGAITAGKFLEHFTSYPWVHIDIAGTAFTKKKEGYVPKGASGFGVRLLTTFLKSLS